VAWLEFHADLERTATALERIADALERAFPRPNMDQIGADEPSGEVLSVSNEDLRRWEEEEQQISGQE
jgi:hypothetical protein